MVNSLSTEGILKSAEKNKESSSEFMLRMATVDTEG